MKIMKWEKADWDPKMDPGPHGRASSGENFVFRFRRAVPLARPVTDGIRARAQMVSERELRWYQSSMTDGSAEKDVEELIDSDGGFCVRDSYLEEIGDGTTLIAR